MHVIKTLLETLIYFVCILQFPSKVLAVTFPKGFKLGVATASYQIEGGWNASGKTVNIWDQLTHTRPELITDHSTGDIACNSYELLETDLDHLQTLKVDHYRFSLSWTRLLPTAFPNRLNPAGVRYYNRLIDGLLARNIEPMVTLHHWDLPQALQDLGGWTSAQTADYFADFARVAFTLFGDRVKAWITINEPASICVGVYEEGAGAPDVVSQGVGLYVCGRNVLLAHARAYRLYQAEFEVRQGGRVGITIDSIWAEPRSNSSADLEGAGREMEMAFGWFANPIFGKSGNYPWVMTDRVGEFSKEEGFARSRLPKFSEEEVRLLRGSADFLGLNHYHTRKVRGVEWGKEEVSFRRDKGTDLEEESGGGFGWGLRRLLNWVRMQYGNPEVVITENGCPDDGRLDDENRIVFLKDMMANMLLAVLNDGCNVKGYTVWSLMDNMEWRSGYTVKFGLYHVNFTDPQRKRTAKASAGFYKQVIQTREVPELFEQKRPL